MIEHDSRCRAESDCPGCGIDDQLSALVRAIRSISHGEINGPTGLEMLSMALAGEGLGDNLSQAIRSAGESIGNGLHAIAEAIGQT